MRISLTSLAALTTLLAMTALPATASARERGHSLTLYGAGGRSATQTRHVVRSPGATRIDRSLQTSGGYGSTTTRDAHWGPGSYASSRQTQLNNGQSMSRSTSATSNGNGTSHFATTLTGPQGQSRTVTRTASRNP